MPRAPDPLREELALAEILAAQAERDHQPWFVRGPLRARVERARRAVEDRAMAFHQTLLSKEDDRA